EIAGHLRPDLVRLVVDEVEGAALDAELRSRHAEDRREERVGLDRGVDQLRGFDERLEPLDLFAIAVHGRGILTPSECGNAVAAFKAATQSPHSEGSAPRPTSVGAYFRFASRR